MSCSFGEKIKISVFGQSHSEAIGIVVDGIPAGIKLDMDKISRFMARRAPGKNAYSTKRKEADIPTIISGIVDGITCGAPLCAKEQRSALKGLFQAEDSPPSLTLRLCGLCKAQRIQ